jgi:hypothetical protein
MSDTLTAAEAKDRALALAVGQRIKVVWGMTNDPTSKFIWKGVVHEVKKDWIVAIYNEGPDDPTVKFDLPYQEPGVVYYSIGADADDRSTGDMLAYARQRVSLLQITVWRPLTWGHLLHPASGDKLMTRAQLMNELRQFFGLKNRHDITLGSDPVEHELATAYETLLAWVSLAQSTADWKQQPFLSLIEPLLVRLCALRRASPLSGSSADINKKRNDAIFAVYEAYQTSTSGRDRLTELMMKPLSKGN